MQKNASRSSSDQKLQINTKMLGEVLASKGSNPLLTPIKQGFTLQQSPSSFIRKSSQREKDAMLTKMVSNDESATTSKMIAQIQSTMPDSARKVSPTTGI